MNVEQLIEELRKFPPESLVIAEGCDCFNVASGVEELPQLEGRPHPAVLITVDLS